MFNVTREFANLYRIRKNAGVVRLFAPKMAYLCLPGAGDPNQSGFKKNVSLLYNAFFALKKLAKEQDAGFDFAMSPLEALWEASEQDAKARNKDKWRYQLLLALPMALPPKLVEQTKGVLAAKRPREAAVFHKIALTVLDEGEIYQALHYGSYDRETPLIEAMKERAKEENYEKNGPHHEIYLRALNFFGLPPLKTLLRQPVKKKI